MSRENVKIVRPVYEALNRRDWDAVFHDMHPDAELTTQRGPTAGTLRGHKQIQEFVEDQFAPFGELSMQPEEFFETGDQVVVFLRVRARPQEGSVDMEVRIGHLWTIRDGTIRSLKTFAVREEALEAAGLSE
jgi:ketosteroid isomerase-like protein